MTHPLFIFNFQLIQILHLGFARNKHIISCFVSTFPVILDTVFKYWIFRHLNRISPSIVANYCSNVHVNSTLSSVANYLYGDVGWTI